jgi:hypothetical protein
LIHNSENNHDLIPYSGLPTPPFLWNPGGQNPKQWWNDTTKSRFIKNGSAIQGINIEKGVPYRLNTTINHLGYVSIKGLGGEGIAYFSLLNYGHYRMSFKIN